MFLKKLLFVLCSVLLILSLVACNQNDGSNNNADAGNNNTNNTNNTNTDDNNTDNNPSDDNQEDLPKDPVVTTQAEAADIADVFVKKDDAGLPYQLYVPADYSEEYVYPVLVFLHGAGERGDDNEAQMKHVIQKLFDDVESPIYQSIVIVPQCPLDNQWVDTPWGEGSYNLDSVKESNELKSVLDILDGVRSTYNVNDDRLYVMGISMGGFGTWDLLMRHSDLFAAGIPICGGADPYQAPVLVDKPIYAIHDSGDGTVPVSATKDMIEALRELGSTAVQYDEITGYGHWAWDYATAKEGLMEWLFEQRLAQ